LQKAEEHYARGLSLYPSSPQFLASLGEIAYERKNFDEAKGFFLHAIQTAPKYESALDKLSIIYYQQQRYDSALIFCQRLLDLQDAPDQQLQKRITTLKNKLMQTR